MIEVNGLTVRFGGVTSLDEMTVTFSAQTCGLIGPNGAGKTTFFNVLSGFVRPSAGSVIVFGEDLLQMRDFRRVRWGMRRTFQTEQAIEDLSVFNNVKLVHEHTESSWARRSAAVLDSLEFVGLADRAEEKAGSLGAGARRLLEIARAVVGRPRLVLLDEPAAGLPERETEHLGSVIRRIPRELDAQVILIDHDMELVSACCETAAVLDFGRLLVSGPTREVLRDERVLRAYLGAEESSS